MTSVCARTAARHRVVKQLGRHHRIYREGTSGWTKTHIAWIKARYSPELEAAVYFWCLEALQNSAKHAGELARGTVRLYEREQILRVEVADTGAGFDPATKQTSAGLQNMTDRIGALGGTVTITSARGSGTTVAVAIPLENHARPAAAEAADV
jgi:signal transduction histidine kinase